jgi:hypothetical protein
MNNWHYQYLEDEKLHYLTELHPEDGILGEHFFETEDEYKKYVKENNLMVFPKVDFEKEIGKVVDKFKENYDEQTFPEIGMVSKGMYHIGGGCYTGYGGWVQFNETIVEASKKWKI